MKLIKKIAVYLIKFIYKSKYAKELESDLKEMSEAIYIANKRKEFEIKKEILDVKKGK